MHSFIRKLMKGGKIKLVEPSRDIAKSYLKKSQKSLVSAKTLMDIENYDDATALTYYSMYYSALGLLHSIGIKSENHTGTMLLLQDVIGIDTQELARAKKERIDKQYYVDFAAAEKDVQEGVKIAEEFNAIIREKIDTINEKDKEKHRETLETLSL